MNYRDGYCYLRYVALLHDATAHRRYGASDVDSLWLKCGLTTTGANDIAFGVLKNAAEGRISGGYTTGSARWEVRCGRLANQPLTNTDHRMLSSTRSLQHSGNRCASGSGVNTTRAVSVPSTYTSSSPIDRDRRLIDATVVLGCYPKASDVFRYLAGVFPTQPHLELPVP